MTRPVKEGKLTVEVDGEWVPYTDADWVVFNREGHPVGFMNVEWGDLSRDSSRRLDRERVAMPLRAVKRFADFAIWREGYSIRLVRRGPELSALLDQHLGKVPTGQLSLPEDKE